MKFRDGWRNRQKILELMPITTSQNQPKEGNSLPHYWASGTRVYMTVIDKTSFASDTDGTSVPGIQSWKQFIRDSQMLKYYTDQYG